MLGALLAVSLQASTYSRQSRLGRRIEAVLVPEGANNWAFEPRRHLHIKKGQEFY